MVDPFHIHLAFLWKIFLHYPADRHLKENTCQILSVNVVEIVVDDVFYGNGKTSENIQILRKRKTAHFQGMLADPVAVPAPPKKGRPAEVLCRKG